MSRIEVVSKVEDSRAKVRLKSLRDSGFDVEDVQLVDAYTLDAELADAHQELQKKVSDWPAERFALRAIANGKIGLHKSKRHPDGNPVVVFEHVEMPYGGFNMVSHYE
ncbi:Uncharacterised protein [uncultured archaeon]|nr:Uncharacterised protein [uncultured archaeon]